jgi:hypothetical protein
MRIRSVGRQLERTLTKRQTQLFALFLLIGAPLVVSLLSGYFLPGIKGISPLATQDVPPAYMQPAPDPAAGLPPSQPEPPPSPAQQTGPQAGGSYTPVAALDTSGVTISGSDPAPLSLGGSDASAPAQSGQEPPTLSADQLHAMNDVH